ncbi:MAG: glucose-6-phosphate isomerase, partial [bacterium]
MSIRWDFSLTQASAIGERCGLTLADVNSLKPIFKRIREQLYQKHTEKEILIWHLPYDDQMLERVASFGERCRTQFENFVVLGIGGSALGTIALHQSINHQQFNLLPREVRRAPRFFCTDNVDPESFGGVLDIIDPQTTLFNVVSKSGTTTETL